MVPMALKPLAYDLLDALRTKEAKLGERLASSSRRLPLPSCAQPLSTAASRRQPTLWSAQASSG